MAYLITSDQHFNHANIIRYANRPFADVEEMDRELIKRWNEVVKPDDQVYHLGDFTLGEKPEKYFEQLNGNIFILKMPWHHDKRWNHRNGFMTKNGFVEYLPPMHTMEFMSGKLPRLLVLCHYPICEWDRKHYGAWHLHGHTHGNFEWGPGDLALDVGVDSWNYYPVRMQQIIAALLKKEQHANRSSAL